MRTLPLIALLALAGCASPVPTTDIQYDMKTGALRVKSPKQIDLQGLKVDLQKGVASVDKLSSTNDATIVSTIAIYNLQMTQSYLDATIKLLQTLGTLKP